MLIIAIKGGLGNQMFQYAFGRKLSLLHNVELYLDLGWFQNPGEDTRRTFGLNQFNIQAKIATIDQVRKLKGGDWIHKTYLVRALRKFSLYKQKSYFKEYRPFYESSIVVNSSSGYYDGHWVDFRYFDDIANVLKNDFSLVTKLSPQLTELFDVIKNTQSVSVHIRRGDYANRKSTQKFHGLLPISYFKTSIERAVKHLDNPHIFFFSDEINWVKENLSIVYPHTYIEPSYPDSEAIDLILMSACKCQIISNSTFSWWAAWLNQNQNKTVIAPPFWSKLIPDSRQILPASWTVNHYE
jgi:hypothetical protein